MAIDYSKFAIPKIPHVKTTRASVKRHRQEQKAKRDTSAHVIGSTRREVFKLDPRCVICLGPPRSTDEMNEVDARSKTRGQEPELRFNRRNCHRVHRECHADITENRVKLAFLDRAMGVDGGLAFQRRGEPFALAYRRLPAPHHEPLGFGTVDKGIWTPQ